MAATGRLLRTSRPCVGIGNSQSCYSFSGPKGSSARFVSKGGFGGEKGIGDGEKQPKSATKVVSAAAAASTRCLVTPEPKTEKGLLDLGLLLGKISTFMFQRLRMITIRLPQKLHAQILMEKAIVDCRFFTWFAVAGSLLGSVLCFIEGCYIIVESYFQYFHAVSQHSDQAHLVHLLIEAIDMFLVGTAMLTFGIGLHVMFVGSNNSKEQMPPLPGSHLLPSLKSLPEKVGMKSVMQAKSKIGHAVVMILQVGVLEKFKEIPLVTSLDLACFAAVVFVSSACVFLLSKLNVSTGTEADT
nr:uncharacterized protein LOC109169728 [Ipomoea batatas]GMD89053.1 uncharacterized protein LOC109169728 [Ipomoea batatas]